LSLTISSPVTGAAQTNLTSPTYTLVADTFPNGTNGKQYAVSAIGGTQTGVDSSSSPARPFVIWGSRPAQLKRLGVVDPVTGVLRNVPRNTYKLGVSKGVTPLAGQTAVPLNAILSVDVPAGAELADTANVRAALSLLFGAIAQISSSFGDTCVTGLI
jgi:hypothetical protein